MKIAIESATMADVRYFPILDVLLVLVETRKHGISVDNLAQVFVSPWFANKAKSDRELLQRAALVRSHDALLDKSAVFIDAGVRIGGVVHLERSETRLHPLDAISFLAMPFSVIVENEDYDGSFLFWMARAVEFDKFIEAYRDGRFNFRHAGGKSGLVRSAKILSRGVWPRQDDRYARAMQLWCCAVLDNDARFPGEEPNKGIVDELKPYVSFVHQMTLRTIESYLPYSAMLQFNASAAFKSKVDALFRLHPVAKRHYHMKRGFRFKDGTIPTKAEFMAAASEVVVEDEKAVYGTISSGDWTLLSDGFGRGLARIFVEEAHRPTQADRLALGEKRAAEMRALIVNIYSRL
jgi:hypothetical protein